MREKGLFEAKNKKFFGRVSKTYDSFFRIWFEQFYRNVGRSIEKYLSISIVDGVRILDVACGTGELVFRMSQKFSRAEFVGVDFTEKMAEQARKKLTPLKNCSVVAGNVHSLPFENESFNIIWCTEAFHHFADPHQALAEIRRVLTLNGKLLIVDFANQGILGLLADIFVKKLEHAHRYYTRQDWQEILSSCGFVCERVEKHGLNYHVFAHKKI